VGSLRHSSLDANIKLSAQSVHHDAATVGDFDEPLEVYA
jgi:hypothetical protein